MGDRHYSPFQLSNQTREETMKIMRNEYLGRGLSTLSEMIVASVSDNISKTKYTTY